MAIFSQRNAFTCGELGYFTGRLAGEGLVSFAATNGPALLAGAELPMAAKLGNYVGGRNVSAAGGIDGLPRREQLPAWARRILDAA